MVRFRSHLDYMSFLILKRVGGILTTLVSWATETVHDSFEAMRYWRWAGLLETDDVSSEAEAKVTWVRPWYLLRRIISFTFVFAAGI